MKARRKIPPLPIEFVQDNPRVIALNVAAFGSLMRLVTHFWFTDCATLPTSGDRLSQIAHAHRPTWAGHKSEVLAILSEILPELKRRREYRDANLRHLVELRQRGAAVKRERKLKRLMQSADSIQKSDIMAPSRSQQTRAARAAPEALQVGGPKFVD